MQISFLFLKLFHWSECTHNVIFTHQQKRKERLLRSSSVSLSFRLHSNLYTQSLCGQRTFLRQMMSLVAITVSTEGKVASHGVVESVNIERNEKLEADTQKPNTRTYGFCRSNTMEMRCECITTLRLRRFVLRQCHVSKMVNLSSHYALLC